MLAGIAIIAVLAVFGSFWTYNMARNPKVWRLWWLTTLNIIDINPPRDRRRSEEVRLAVSSTLMCVFFVCTFVFCVYRVTVEIQERHREKTQFEQDQEQTRKQFELMKSSKDFQKLK